MTSVKSFLCFLSLWFCLHFYPTIFPKWTGELTASRTVTVVTWWFQPVLHPPSPSHQANTTLTATLQPDMHLANIYLVIYLVVSSLPFRSICNIRWFRFPCWNKQSSILSQKGVGSTRIRSPLELEAEPRTLEIEVSTDSDFICLKSGSLNCKVYLLYLSYDF